MSEETGDPNAHQGSLCPQTLMAVSQILLQQRQTELPEVNTSLGEPPSIALSPCGHPIRSQS